MDNAFSLCEGRHFKRNMGRNEIKEYLDAIVPKTVPLTEAIKKFTDAELELTFEIIDCADDIGEEDE